jgi:hypothetical protein
MAGCGCKWSLLKVREGKYRWNLGAERVCFSSPDAFKIYANLWKRRNQVSGEGHGLFLGQVRVVPEPGHGHSEMQY